MNHEVTLGRAKDFGQGLKRPGFDAHLAVCVPASG